jgi:hypothetical protein
VVIKSTTWSHARAPVAVSQSRQHGNVLLSGYHYPEAIQTARIRETEIQHDYAAGIKWKIAPEFYD